MFIRSMKEWSLNSCSRALGAVGIKMEWGIALRKKMQGKVGIFFSPLLHMLKLTQIKGEKKQKKDSAFLNIIHHILKTDCTEHYHAHNKPCLLESLLHLWLFLQCFLFPSLVLRMMLLSHRIICLASYIYQAVWWRTDSLFQYFFIKWYICRPKKTSDVRVSCEFQCYCSCLGKSKILLL